MSEALYLCPHCRDTWYEPGEPIHKYGQVYETVKKCRNWEDHVALERAKLAKEGKAGKTARERPFDP